MILEGGEKSSEGKSKLTPMMRQYLDIKAQNPDTLLLYRLGDFYELFHDDAIIASRILGLTLTSRNHGGQDKTPLAGFPYHAVERYIPKLIQSGHRVAICEQVEDPATAKGVVKRKVVEVITRGTAINDNYLEAKSNNFLTAFFPDPELSGLSCLDLSTGAFETMEGNMEQCIGEIYRLQAQEVLVPENREFPPSLQEMQENEKVLITNLPSALFNESTARELLQRQFQVHSLESFGCAGVTRGIRCAGAALSYVRDHKKSKLSHLTGLKARSFDNQMVLDGATIRNLELIRPLHSDDQTGTLFHLLDKTVTSMGGRLLKQWLTHPLLNKDAILQRQSSIAELIENQPLREQIRSHLGEINDIERIVAKIGSGRANARDLQGLGRSLIQAGKAGEFLIGLKSELLHQAGDFLKEWSSVGEELLTKLVESPPLTVREGGMIRPEAFPELQQLLDSTRQGREWIAGLQIRERERTGIPSLKVGYNKVFGYYIEVSKIHQQKVPEEYHRKQSLVNAERYITPEMKEWENKILSAESEINGLEYRLFSELREQMSERSGKFLEVAFWIAQSDLFSCLAEIAVDLNFNPPELCDHPVLEIHQGRHPVVEKMVQEGKYIANDAHLDASTRQILLVTGPNMAGKSTYLRQVGLIVLLAQMGSFVPAQSAKIGLVDRIFTRVGAADRLARGQSTFMVEMIETANILHNASPRSLVLLDEIGRGTSTWDGLSLAWSIVETMHNTRTIAARTMFATHYHEITALAEQLKRVQNVQVMVKESKGEVIFLREIQEGACDSSYGIQVAKMAGIPQQVIDRAWEILKDLESQQTNHPQKEDSLVQEKQKYQPHPSSASASASTSAQQQLELPLIQQMKIVEQSPNHRDSEKVLRKLLDLDLNRITPLDLVWKIRSLQESARKGVESI